MVSVKHRSSATTLVRVRPFGAFCSLIARSWSVVLGGMVLYAPSVCSAEEAEAAAPAVARQSSEEVTRLNEVGMQLYTARDYRRAVEKFIQAYAIDHDPNLLFNIARCYEQLGDSGAAIEKYEEFVKMPGADTQGRQRAYDSLSQLEQLVAAAEGAPEPPLNTGQARNESAASTVEAPPPSPEPPAAERRDGPGILPWFLLGTGVVAAGVGTTVYVLGQADHDQVREAPNFGQSGRVVDMTESEARAWVELGDEKKLYGMLGLGLGGALLVTSAVLFVVGSEPQESVAPQVAVVPSNGGAGVFVAGSF
jgi:tetratricopeptide (TPR) repeat protein